MNPYFLPFIHFIKEVYQVVDGFVPTEDDEQEYLFCITGNDYHLVKLTPSAVDELKFTCTVYDFNLKEKASKDLFLDLEVSPFDIVKSEQTGKPTDRNKVINKTLIAIVDAFSELDPEWSLRI